MTKVQNLKTEILGQFIKMKGMPYAEWYYNTLRLNGSKTETFHKDAYGDKSYADFRDDFRHDLTI